MTKHSRAEGRVRPVVGPLLTILLASLGTSIANVALPQLARAFAAPFATVQWVVIAYLLALTVCSAGAGRLGDRIGHGRALRAGIAVFVVGAVAAALSPNIGCLIPARMVQGAGAAVMIVLPMAVLRDRTPADRLGRAMGLLGTASAIGTAMGPAVGGVLIAGLGWSAIFWVLAGVGVICIGLVPADAVNTTSGAKPAKYELAGALSFAMVIAGVALTLTLPVGGISVVVLTAAGVGLIAFLRAERTAAVPYFPRAVLADAGLRRGLAANALVAAVMMTTLVVGPFYLARGLGLGSAAVGLVLAVGPVVSALSGLPAGRMVDRFGPARVAQMGVLAMAVAAGLIAGFAPRVGLIAYVAGIALLTPGYQLFLAAITTAVLTTAAQSERGAIAGLLGLSRNVGLIFGAAGMGALFARATGRGDAATADAAQIGFAVTASFAVAAALLIAAALLVRPDARAAIAAK